MRALRAFVLVLASAGIATGQGVSSESRIPQSLQAQTVSAPLLMVGGTTMPGDTVRMGVSGAPPLRETWLAWSLASGATVLNLGANGVLTLGLQWPINFELIGNTDASGQIGYTIPISAQLPPNYLQGIDFHFQMVTIEPGGPPGTPYMFHVSNDGQVTDQYLEHQEWSALKAAAVGQVGVAAGWGTPQLVAGPCNSIGWEDSVAISPDGQTLYFTYIPCDLMSWTGADYGRFDRFNRHHRGPARGVTPEYSLDVFYATGSGATFGAPLMSPVSANAVPRHRSEAGLVPAGSSFCYSANGPATALDNDTDIYLGNAKLPFCTDAGENDPTLEGGTLLFWSGDLGGVVGPYRIYLTQGSGTSWSTPVALPSSVNAPGSDSWQPHLTPQGKLYFSSNRGGPLGIWTCNRLSTNTWSTPAPVVWPVAGSAAVAVAEPSLTANGQWLYFCVLFRNAAGAYDLDIACSRRLP